MITSDPVGSPKSGSKAGRELSPEQAAAAAMVAEARQRTNRPLDAMYVAVFMEAIHVKGEGA